MSIEDLNILLAQELKQYHDIDTALKNYGSTLSTETATKIVDLIKQLITSKETLLKTFQTIPIDQWAPKNSILRFFIDHVLKTEIILEPDKIALFLKLDKFGSLFFAISGLIISKVPPSIPIIISFLLFSTLFLVAIFRVIKFSI